MINYQVSRLTEDERRLLEVASVAGGDFSAALVAAGLSRDAVEVERELEAFTRKDHTLVPSGTSERPDGTYSGSYAFRHILYQNVAYQHLAPVLALHFEQGRDFASALRYLGQAAESSAKRLGHAEAAGYLTRPSAFSIASMCRTSSSCASRCCGIAALRFDHLAISRARSAT